MSGWPKKKLGEIVDFFSGYAWKAAQFSDDTSGIPIIRIQNVDAVRQSDFAYWLDDYDARFLINVGDILLTLSGSFRVEVWPGPKALLNQRIVKITPKAQIDRNWLLHSLRGALAKIEAMGRHALVNNVALSDLRDMQLACPPLEEQKRIAAILDQADELRRQRRRAIDRLNQLGQAIFYEMFGHIVDNPESSIELTSLLKFVTSGGRGWSKYYAETGARFIRSFDVKMNFIGADDMAFVDAPDNAEARRTAVQEGDVLLTITGSKIGRVAPVPKGFGTAFISQHVAILRLDQFCILPEFLSYYLSLPNGGQLQIAKNQYGQTKPGLNFDQIGRFLVPNISIEQQVSFVAAIKQIENISDHGVLALERKERLFKSLQHRAFQGEM